MSDFQSASCKRCEQISHSAEKNSCYAKFDAYYELMIHLRIIVFAHALIVNYRNLKKMTCRN